MTPTLTPQNFVAKWRKAAVELLRLRDAWLNPAASPIVGATGGGTGGSPLPARTLTNLYNTRPTWLDNAHRKLDAAVLAACGWPAVLSDEEILERLLALNLARAGGK